MGLVRSDNVSEQALRRPGPLERLIGQARGLIERGGRGGEPVCILGQHRAVIGAGRGARLFLDALRQGGVDARAWDVSAVLSREMTLPAPSDDVTAARSVIAHLNPPDLVAVLARAPGPRPRRGRRIGYWTWETTRVPDDWSQAIPVVDEIWCPSTFTANAVRSVVRGRRAVRVVPHPVLPATVGVPDKARFGLRTDIPTLLCAFDLNSSVERKNPFGAIEAFRRSGCGARGEAELLVKFHGGESGKPVAQQLEALAADVPGVRLMNARLQPDEMRALRASIDIVLSLHRAEGFGLVLAEAMRAGKVVIATGWSGNMDFMDARSAALIQAREVPARDQAGLYTTGLWADPDLDHAAELIRQVVRDRRLRARIGAAAVERIGLCCNLQDWHSTVMRHLR